MSSKQIYTNSHMWKQIATGKELVLLIGNHSCKTKHLLLKVLEVTPCDQGWRSSSVAGH